MKGLTEAEALTIEALLGSRQESERELLERASLSRSTYQDARRRAYASGWLKDRYVPNPPSFGFTRAVFLLANPFADQLAALTEDWCEAPGSVVVWSSPQLCIGVFLSRDGRSSKNLVDRLVGSNRVQSSTAVVADLQEEDSVPVYFDFEGIWTHLVGVHGTQVYPRRLVTAQARGEPLSPSTLRGARDLVVRPIYAEADGHPWRNVGPFWLPRTQRRLVEEGHLNHRVLLQPGSLEDFRGRAVDQGIFISGEPKAGSSGGTLLTELNQAGAFPWLVASGSGRLLVGLAAQASPPPPEAGTPIPIHTNLMGLIAKHVQSVNVVREAFANFYRPLQHRYDRLFRTA